MKLEHNYVKMGIYKGISDYILHLFSSFNSTKLNFHSYMVVTSISVLEVDAK